MLCSFPGGYSSWSVDDMGVSELFMTIDPSHHEDQAIWRTHLMVYDTLGIWAPMPLYRLYNMYTPIIHVWDCRSFCEISGFSLPYEFCSFRFIALSIRYIYIYTYICIYFHIYYIYNINWIQTYLQLAVVLLSLSSQLRARLCNSWAISSPQGWAAEQLMISSDMSTLRDHFVTYLEFSKSLLQDTLLGTNYHPLLKGTFEDDLVFPQVGYVSSLEAKSFFVLHSLV